MINFLINKSEKMKAIQKELVKAIRERTPKGINVVDIVTDLIPMSKEAAYRRLRGCIPFTLDETVQICNKLGISLDHLVELEHENQYTFHVIPMNSSDPLEEYYKMMTHTLHRIKRLQSAPKSFLLTAQNTLSHFFAFKYNLISKMKIFKWVYNTNPPGLIKRMENIIIHPKVIQLQKEYMNTGQLIPSSVILDESIINNIIQDIIFFTNIEIISEKEVAGLKEELHGMIDDMEHAAVRGAFPSGVKANIYISHTFFDATYLYAQNAESKFCSIHYGLNHLVCENELICDNQRLWIESLIRYSTLISNSGEFIRMQFFKKLRNDLDSLAILQAKNV